MHPSPTPAAEPAWRPLRPHDPARLGSYQLLGRLGSGGMGVVYAARAQPGGGLVAVKVIRAGLTDREELRRRFRREVEAARSVAPFCTAAVLDADLDAPVPYIVSEYVAGPTLDRLVRQRGPLPPSRGAGPGRPGCPSSRTRRQVLAQLSDPIPAPRDDKRFVASVSAFTPGSTPERPAWFDALIDNYTVWYDDARVLPAG